MTQNRQLTLATVSHVCTQDRAENLARVADGIARACAQGAQIICLQELHSSLYFCQTQTSEHFKLAEPLDGPTCTTLANLAKQHQVVIVGSIFEKRAAGLYHNTAVVFDTDGTRAGIYRKMHIPDDPGFNEKFYFTPGDLGFKPIKTAYATLGVLVCWDQWFPEAARLMCLAGAEILCYPTAIGWVPSDTDALKETQRNAWVIMHQSHAIANGVPVMATNRIGHEAGYGDGIDFWGNSIICDPQGQLIAVQNEKTVAIATVKMGEIDQQRETWPFLRDRRIDAYQDLLKRIID